MIAALASDIGAGGCAVSLFAADAVRHAWAAVFAAVGLAGFVWAGMRKWTERREAVR